MSKIKVGDHVTFRWPEKDMQGDVSSSGFLVVGEKYEVAAVSEGLFNSTIVLLKRNPSEKPGRNGWWVDASVVSSEPRFKRNLPAWW